MLTNDHVAATRWAILALALMTTFLGANPAAADSWVPLPSMPGAKGDAFGALWNGQWYIVGGAPWQNDGDQDGSVYKYTGGGWGTLAPLNGVGPFIAQGGGVDALNRLVFFGGIDPSSGDGGPTMTYDPIDGAVTTLPSRPGSAAKQGFGFATDDQGRLYSIGGGNGAGASASSLCVRYSAIGNSWSTLAPLPAAVSQTCAAYDGEGHIYVFGGFNANGTARVADVQRYDIASNTWSNTNTPDMPVAISHARAVVGTDHRIYVVGGIDMSGAVRSATLVLDLWENSWSNGPTMSTARERPAVIAGEDSNLYVFGGHGVGGTALATAETLYTPECPTIIGQPEDATGWYGIPVGFQVVATGGTPLTYQWRRDGATLVDGPMGTGGVVSGATTAMLAISGASAADDGAYDVVVSTPCGSETSAAVHFALVPAPRVPTHWTVRNLHPSWADGSYLNAIDGATQVGGTYLPFQTYSTIDRPTIWHGSAESAVNVTPLGSAGGEILAVDGDASVGWWWWPYSCGGGGQYTCYSVEAAEWTGDGASHLNLQVSGWEFSEIAALTNGVCGGYVWTDDYGPDTYTFNAGVWLPPNNTFVNVQPSWVWRSIIEAADGGHQYGWIFRNDAGPAHAARWTASAASCTDMNPASESRSLLYGAGDGQQVGITGPATAYRAGVWGGSAAAFRSLHPAGATSSGAYGCDGGFQVGEVSTPTSAHAALWAGSPESMIDLNELLPAGYTGAYAYDVDVASDGTVRVVGTAYSATELRWEAILWESTSAVQGDLNGDGAVDGSDLAILLGAWGTSGPVADLDQNGTVDGADLAMVLGAWG